MADDPSADGPPGDGPGGLSAGPPDEPPTDETGSVLAARVEPVVIEDEMKSSYMDYAMSVIVGRALPDVRDGLKPVHRRILHAMDEGGLRPNRPYRKCASAVGDVMKKYHPHGDTAIYDALVRMGQDFSSRYTLVDGHGNFGSIDGDPAAAMRYTEARLSKLAMELLADIDEDTVDFVDNYDGYETEPVVLPARFPNLLANGATGIAVGMATNIPPHNLTELIDATIALIDDPELDAVDLMEYVPGPDFPTGGLIVGRNGAYEAYTTGRGSIKARAVCTIEEADNRERIVVSEIPFMVNKSTLLQKIAALVNERTVEGIADLRDESARGGLRIVIDCKRDANPQIVLNQLYKHTQLQDTFGANMLALVDGVPKTLTLDEILHHYVDHQREVIRRRTSYRLRKARQRAHVLEGLLTALSFLDEVIELIRASESAEDARTGLMDAYELSETQAQAILDMQLRRLAALERQKIADEYEQLQERIGTYEDILGDPDRVREIVKEELAEIRATYGDERRSTIVPDEGEMTVEDLIPEGEIVLTLTRDGYVKRTPVDAFRTQRRGGRGVRGAKTGEDDLVSQLVTCSTHDHLLFFTNQGRVYRVKAYQVPEKSRDAKGVYVANVPGLAFEDGEYPAAVMSLSRFDRGEEADGGRYVVFATQQGTVKRTRLEDFDSRRSVLIAVDLNEGDELVGVGLTHGDDEIMLVSRHGYAIRFPESEARAMGRTAAGVRGMSLEEGDEVLAMAPVQQESDQFLLVVTEAGYGKRTPVARYPVQGRGGKGVVTASLTDDKGHLAGALIVPWEAEMLMVTDTGTLIRMDVADVRPMGRNTQGVRLMRPGDGASVAGLALVVEDAGESGDDGDDGDDGGDGEAGGSGDDAAGGDA